jgi:hypothetical protein
MATVLVLILIIALFGISAVHHALLGRALASTRTFHQRAFGLAELGIASEIAGLRAGATLSPIPRLLHPVPSPADGAMVTTREVASNALPQGFSADRFVEKHYEISSEGQSARNARVSALQGLRRVTPLSATSP